MYPETAANTGETAPKLGVCLSGGGSRALTCALGQLSTLRHLQDPNDSGKTLLDRVDYLSSVSGGSWASVLYVFLPETINGKPVSDDDFFITPCAPQSLIKREEHEHAPENVSYMNPFCLGTAPQQFNPVRIAEFLYTLYEWDFIADSKKWHWFWIAAVGEIILKPFGLYSASYDHKHSYIEPSRFFSLSDDHIKTAIMPNNPSLGPQQFYTCRENRPSVFVNYNLLKDDIEVVSSQIPVQATPIDTGILGRSPDGTIVGGGSVESFAFASMLKGPGVQADMAEVTMNRRYSLCDIAGCSSAFFAAYLLYYIDKENDAILNEVKKLLEDLKIPKWLAKDIVSRMESHIDSMLNVEASKLIPAYNYWPLGAVGKSEATNGTYGFSDGGDFENTGILGMLARTDATRIIAFVNGETPLSKGPESGEVMVDSQLPVLFGYKGKPVDGKYVSYGGMNPKEPLSYVQVFEDDNGGQSQFTALCQGLYNASCGGPDKDTDLGSYTVAFTQTLTTIDNPVAQIQGRRRVTVLWVYNNRVNAWQDAVADSDIQSDLKQGQADQNRDGTPKSKGSGSGPLENFPYYATGAQIYIDKEGVNLLAQLSAWNVEQLAGEIYNLIDGPSE